MYTVHSAPSPRCNNVAQHQEGGRVVVKPEEGTCQLALERMEGSLLSWSEKSCSWQASAGQQHPLLTTPDDAAG